MAPVGGLVEVDGAKAWGTKPADAPSDHVYRINSVGYRASSFAVNKPEGLIRIVVLGGSAVFDPNSSDASENEGNSWPDLVQRDLEADGLGPLEVINAGVPAHASFDSLGRLHSQLWMYEPDIVLVYHAWNDIKFWKRFEIDPQTPLIERVHPYNEDQNPFIRYRNGWDRLFCHSQLYVKLRNRYLKSQLKVGLEGRIDPDADERASSYGPWGPRQFRLHIELIADAARNIGALPVLVTQASLISSENTPAERERIGYHYQLLSHDALVAALEEANEIIRSIGRDKEIAVIDAAASLNGRAEMFKDGVHTTPEGSQALAALVARGLAPHLR